MATRIPSVIKMLIDEHGGPHIMLDDILLLPDGTRWRQVSGQGWFQFRASTTDLQKLQARKEYHTAFAKQIERDLKSLDYDMRGVLKYGFKWDTISYGQPLSTPEDNATLLACLLDEHRSAIASIDEQIAELPEMVQKRHAEEYNAAVETQHVLQHLGSRRKVTTIVSEALGDK